MKSLEEELEEIEKEIAADSNVSLSPEGNYYYELAERAAKIARSLLETL